VGLANAAVMQFEATRADAEPDGAALARAVQHAHVACQLDPDYAEAWATLGFALARAGHLGADVLARLGAGGTTPADALAAARRATMIEKENWRHQLCQFPPYSAPHVAGHRGPGVSARLGATRFRVIGGHSFSPQWGPGVSA
jgi:hypothetical protein